MLFNGMKLKGKKLRLVRLLFLFFMAISLSGCARLIAYQIATQHTPSVSGNLSETFKTSRLCSTSSECIRVQRSPDIAVSQLEFSLTINNKTKVWTFKDSGRGSTSDGRHLIFIFPGYGTAKAIVSMHQQWLTLMTGADVIVVESADSAEHFAFGLNAVTPIVSAIEEQKPTKVDLIGISMGSVAAFHIASKIEGARLHLIAPMTDFHHSTLALWNILHKDKIYSSFISTQDIEDAIALVYKNAKTKASDIDIIKNIKEKLTETYVYTSSNDRVALELDWEELDTTNVTRLSFSNLNHLEMSSLMDEELLTRFISNLMDTELETSLQTTGLICRSNQQACVKD